MEIIFPNLLANDFSSPILLSLALLVTALSCVFADLLTVRSKSKSLGCCGGGSRRGSVEKSETTAYLNGGSSVVVGNVGPGLNGEFGAVGGKEEEMVQKVFAVVPPEKQTGASMMEQLVPEITTHALSYLDYPSLCRLYLDYPSLCRLSMTNSLMRKAANDDNAWKALYHKDFTLEQDSVTPINGWKAYYAATRAIVNRNNAFFLMIKDRSIAEMGRFWLNADYVKCFHASGEFFTGYNAVMQSWRLAFNWEQGVNFDVQDVRARVLTDVAWVTMKAYVNMESGPFNITNVFEFHNGRWFMVHHHSSVMINGGAEQHMMQG